ncbi:hypothetical protein AJ78_03700 [Emergomyces pasteurianus Ep9510]|uniref:Uncharacterized protein n=1 Tax=Emergomyces pasteurianus Ep9510 TaxID=1447872 RepID=A0A1J9PI29_9EURO|nr:hypothetical protein AJ78_03700 [Emergomyces pasteurianus Ep9510]
MIGSRGRELSQNGEGHGFGLQIMALYSDRVAEFNRESKWTTVSDRRSWPKYESAATKRLVTSDRSKPFKSDFWLNEAQHSLVAIN